MWTIKEVDDNPTCFLIVNEADTAIASVYNRDQAAAIVERYNLVVTCHNLLAEKINSIKAVVNN